MRKSGMTIAVFALTGAVLYGGTFTWSGPKGGLWGDPASWTPNGVPSAKDDVILDQQESVTVAGATARAGSVAINSKDGFGGVVLESSGNSRLEVTGDLNQSGGSFMIRKVDSNEAQAVISGNYNAKQGAVTVLQKGKSPSNLIIGGNLTAGKNFKFRFPLNKAKDFGAITVKGAVNLGGAKLELFQLEGGLCTAPRLPLIINSSTNTLTGAFENAPFNSATYELNGWKYTLRLGDYDGGGVANDVYLEADVKILG